MSSEPLNVESGSLVKRRLGKGNVFCLELGWCLGVAVWSLEEWRPGRGGNLGSGVVLAGNPTKDCTEKSLGRFSLVLIAMWSLLCCSAQERLGESTTERNRL